jgi:hypothetical protein
LSAFIDITGQRFGRLVALRRNGHSRCAVVWECICDCGAVKNVNGTYLRDGTTTSCGCYHREAIAIRMTKHGFAPAGKLKTEYNTYRGMILRCTNPNAPSYRNYGGRGITVCDRWRESFTLFLEDMGLKPEKNYQLDRIDNDKGYSPDNCRWTTPTKNSNNRRNNVIIKCGGESKTLTEWANLVGVSRSTIDSRIKRGWSPERAVCEPTR